MMIGKKITIITAVNNRNVFKANLLRSQLLQEPGVQLITLEKFKSASQAYNYGISKAKGDLLIFVHQDVYLPLNWKAQLYNSIEKIECKDKKWAVIGVVGVNKKYEINGLSWSNGLARFVGCTIPEPIEAISLDELLLVINLPTNIKFDENLPGWHLYGTAIVLEALERNLSAYIINAPVLHNSLPVLKFDKEFESAYHYIRRKWKHCLPIKTTCVMITRSAWQFRTNQLLNKFKKGNRQIFLRFKDPQIKAKEIGFDV